MRHILEKKTLYSLEPYFVEKIWGAKRLKDLKNIEMKELLGESWEVSNLKEGSSSCEGRGELSSWLTKKELPYLVKFLDTSDYLSVQVHPDDQYAQKVEKSSGKSECWLILEAEKDAGIYLGFKEDVNKEEFEKAIKEGRDVSHFLNFFPVKPGDFFFVPSKTVHAIGKGVLLCEVQQSSGITYRVWDWNRVDSSGNSRELHIDKALDVLEFDSVKNCLAYFKYQSCNFSVTQEMDLLKHHDFNVSLISSDKAFEFSPLESSERVISIINFNQPLKVAQETQALDLAPYQSCLSTGKEKIIIEPKKGVLSCFIVVY